MPAPVQGYLLALKNIPYKINMMKIIILKLLFLLLRQKKREYPAFSNDFYPQSVKDPLGSGIDVQLSGAE